MKFRFVKYLSVVILAAFALVGCENGMDDNGNGNEGDGVVMRLNVLPRRYQLDYCTKQLG